MKQNTTYTPPVNETNLTPFREVRKPDYTYGPKTEYLFRRDMRGRIAVVRQGGKVRYLDSRDEPTNFYNFKEMQQILRHYTLISDEGKPRCVLTAYLEDLDRREYFGIEFQPDTSKANPKLLNTFEGFAVKPKRHPAASYAMFKEHVFHNVCGGAVDVEDAFWSWWAHLFQHPGKKIGVALVLQGDKGSGKSFVSDVLAHLIGRRYCPVVDAPEHLTGKFNNHLMNAILVQVEEALHAADPRHESRIKHLITGDRLMIEPKGVNAFAVESRLNVLMTTNQHQVVAASGDERRYLVLKVGNGWRQQGHRFAAMKAQLESGGYELLMADLLATDISGRDWSKPIKTAALSQQIVASMRGIERWWAESLAAGRLPFNASTPDGIDTDAAWPESGESWEVDAATVHASAAQFGRDYQGAPSPAVLGKFLSANCAGVRRDKRQVANVRSPTYVFPSLEACRAAFLASRPNLFLEHLAEPVARETDDERKVRATTDAEARKAAAEARKVDAEVRSAEGEPARKLASVQGGRAERRVEPPSPSNDLAVAA